MCIGALRGAESKRIGAETPLICPVPCISFIPPSPSCLIRILLLGQNPNLTSQ